MKKNAAEEDDKADLVFWCQPLSQICLFSDLLWKKVQSNKWVVTGGRAESSTVQGSIPHQQKQTQEWAQQAGKCSHLKPILKSIQILWELRGYIEYRCQK